MPFLNDPMLLREIIMDHYQNPRNKEEVNVFLVSNIFEAPVLNIYKYDDLSNLDRTINSMKYEEESL